MTKMYIIAKAMDFRNDCVSEDKCPVIVTIIEDSQAKAEEESPKDFVRRLFVNVDAAAYTEYADQIEGKPVPSDNKMRYSSTF